MKNLISTMTALAVAFTASAALAGVYISGPLPSEFAGGTIPSDPDVFKASGKSSKEGIKLATGMIKCYSKGAKNVSKGKPTGVADCITGTKKGVITKYNSKVAGLSPLPGCSNAGPVAAAQIQAIVSSFNGLQYCQSPSGAFIDDTNF